MRRVPAPTQVNKHDVQSSFPEPPTQRRIPSRGVRRQRRKHACILLAVLLAVIVTGALLHRHRSTRAFEKEAPTSSPVDTRLTVVPTSTGVVADTTTTTTSSAHATNDATTTTHSPPSSTPPFSEESQQSNVPTTTRTLVSSSSTTAPSRPTIGSGRTRDDAVASVGDHLEEARDGLIPIALFATQAASAWSSVTVDRAELTDATFAPSRQGEGSAVDDVTDGSAKDLMLPSNAGFIAQLRAAGLDEVSRRSLLPSIDVRLLRQRLSRSLWATPATFAASGSSAHHLIDADTRHAAQLPIISLDPQEGLTESDDTALYVPTEVLIEEYGDGDSGRRQQVDPESAQPAFFEEKPLSSKEGPTHTVRIYTKTTATESDAEGTPSSPLPLPVLQVQTASSLPASVTSTLTGLVANGSVVQWLLHATPSPSVGKETDAAVGDSPSIYAQLRRCTKTELAHALAAAAAAAAETTSKGATGRAKEDLSQKAWQARQREWEKEVSMDPTIPSFPLTGSFWLPRVERLRGLMSRPVLAREAMDTEEEDAEEAKAAAVFSSDIPLHGFYEFAETTGAAPYMVPSTASHNNPPGVVPLVIAELQSPASPHGDEGEFAPLVVGIFWLNSAPLQMETDTSATTAITRLTFHNTGGATRVFLLPGPTLEAVLRQYYTITGFPTLPPRHAFGLQHGYVDATEATQDALVSRSDALARQNVPTDGIFCTVEAMHRRRVPFSFEPTRFADPTAMQMHLWRIGRRFLYVRNEPSVPVRQHLGLYMEARSHQYLVSEDPDNDRWLTLFTQEGEVAHAIDFTNRRARHWFGGTHKFKRFVNSTNYTFFFLQNAAPVFSDGAENTMRGATLPMQAGHYGGMFHREVHNAYNFLYALASYHGTLRRQRYLKRAVTWTENFFVGTQRVAIWAYRGAAGALVDTQVPTAAAATTTQASRSDGDARATHTAAPSPLLPWLRSSSNISREEGTSYQQRQKSIVNAAWSSYRQGLGHILSLATLGVPFASANVADTTFYLHEFIQLASEETGTRDDGDLATELLQLEELFVRFYQLGVVMPVVHSEGLYGATSTLAEAVASSASAASQCGAFFFLPNTLIEETSRAALEAVLGGGTDTIDAILARWQALEALAHGAVQVRYALLPYLYTAAWRTSVLGEPFWRPLSLDTTTSTPASSEDEHNTAMTTTTTCFSVGRALLACPPLDAGFTSEADTDVARVQRIHLPALSATRAWAAGRGEAVLEGEYGWFHVWTGEHHDVGESVALPTVSTVPSSSSSSSAPPVDAWLAEPEVVRHMTLGTSPVRLPNAVQSSTPLFQAAGSVLVTQNVFRVVAPSLSSSSSASGSVAAVVSAEMPTNLTLTVALPSLRAAQAHLQRLPWREVGEAPTDTASVIEDTSLRATRTRRLRVASGVHYWDDGASNMAVPPPPAATGKSKEGGPMVLPKTAFCHVHITCDLVETVLASAPREGSERDVTDDDDADADEKENAVVRSVFSLVLSGRQVGEDCEEALQTWDARHDDFGVGFTEYLKLKETEEENKAWRIAMDERRRQDNGDSATPASAHSSHDGPFAGDRVEGFSTPRSTAELRQRDEVAKYWDGLSLASMHLISRVRFLFADQKDQEIFQLPPSGSLGVPSARSSSLASDEENGEDSVEKDENEDKRGVAPRTFSSFQDIFAQLHNAQVAAVSTTPTKKMPEGHRLARFILAQHQAPLAVTSPRTSQVEIDLTEHAPRHGSSNTTGSHVVSVLDTATYLSTSAAPLSWRCVAKDELCAKRVHMFGAHCGGDDVRVEPDGQWSVIVAFAAES